MPGVVGCDTHMNEPGAMWEFIDEEIYHKRPILAPFPTDTLYRKSNAA